MRGYKQDLSCFWFDFKKKKKDFTLTLKFDSNV